MPRHSPCALYSLIFRLLFSSQDFRKIISYPFCGFAVAFSQSLTLLGKPCVRFVSDSFPRRTKRMISFRFTLSFLLFSFQCASYTLCKNPSCPRHARACCFLSSSLLHSGSLSATLSKRARTVDLFKLMRRTSFAAPLTAVSQFALACFALRHLPRTKRMVGFSGLEPPTSRLSGVCSNLLS